MASEWLQEARTLKSLARKNKSEQVFLQPVYKGKRLTLEYRKLKLRIRGMEAKTIRLLRKSHVPRFLNNETYRNWGGLTPAVLFIDGTIIRSRKNPKKKYFVATRVYGENDVTYHNQITSMSLLFARNFFTLIAECSWMNTDDVHPASLKKRLEAKANLRIESRNGKAFRPDPPIALEVYDCMGWEPPKKGKK